MRGVGGVSLSLLLGLLGTGCSRANVESLNEMNRGVELASARQYVEAAAVLERAAALDTSNAQAYYNLAIVHMEMRKFAAAKEDLVHAIAADPASAAYQEKLGTVLIELEDFGGAKKALEAAIERDPRLFKAHYKLAQVLERLDDQQGALERYTQSIEAGPSFLMAYRQLGRLYADLGYLDHAVQVSQSALKVAQPGSEDAAEIHNLLGSVYQQQQKFDEAAAQYKEALAISPLMRDAMFALGWTYALQGNKEDAVRYLKKFLSVAGDAPQHYQQAARDKVTELEQGT